MAEPPHPNLRLLLSSPTLFLALGGGAGLAPYAPGTAGSLLAVPLVLLLQTLPFAGQIAIWMLMTGAGIWICDKAGRVLGEPDHPAIVWDEICGITIVLLLCPPGLGWVVAGLLAFRAFDIVKPWPINIVDRRFANGAGAMGDDLLAAVYAMVTISVLHLLTSTIVGID